MRYRYKARVVECLRPGFPLSSDKDNLWKIMHRSMGDFEITGKGMPNLVNKELCTACTVCVNICPERCLDMRADQYGFAHPFVVSIQPESANLRDKESG